MHTKRAAGHEGSSWEGFLEHTWKGAIGFEWKCQTPSEKVGVIDQSP